MQQTVAQHKVAELTVMNQPTPLSNLPQWARVNTLDKARYPRPFEKDKQVYPNNGQMLAGEPSNNGVVQGGGYKSRHEDVTSTGNEPEVSLEDPYRRIQHLERSLAFLRQQHSEFLHCLHEEIDQLKRENKDLNFKIVMTQQKSEPNSPSLKEKNMNTEEDVEHLIEEEIVSDDLPSRRPSDEPTCPGTLEPEDLILPESKLEKDFTSLSLKSKSITNASMKTPTQDEKLEELRIIFLEEEVRKLRNAYQELRKRNSYLSTLLEQSEGRRLRQLSTIESLRYQLNWGGGHYSMEQSLPPPSRVQRYALINDITPRQRTLQEKETFIQHLQQVNERQTRELDTLKCDLRDVFYSHKWTPDAYLSAKAYIVEDDAKATVKDAHHKVGKIQLKQSTKKIRDIGYVAETVTLPPLKQTIGNRAVERRKRTEILQKERLRRSEVL